MSDRSIELGVKISGEDVSGVKALQTAAREVASVERAFRSLDIQVDHYARKMSLLQQKGGSQGGFLRPDDFRSYERSAVALKDHVELLRKRADVEENLEKRSRMMRHVSAGDSALSAYNSSGISRLQPGRMGLLDTARAFPVMTGQERWDSVMGSSVGQVARRGAGMALQGIGALGAFQGFSTLFSAMQTYEQGEKGIADVGLKSGLQFDKLRATIASVRTEYKFLTADTLAAAHAMASQSGLSDVSGAAPFAAAFGRDAYAPVARTAGVMLRAMAASRTARRAGDIAAMLPTSSRISAATQAASLAGGPLGPNDPRATMYVDGQPGDAGMQGGINSLSASLSKRSEASLAAEAYRVLTASFSNSGLPAGQVGEFLSSVGGMTMGPLGRGVLPGVAAPNLGMGAAGPLLAAISGIHPDAQYAGSFASRIMGGGGAGGQLGFALRARALQSTGPMRVPIPGTTPNFDPNDSQTWPLLDPSNPMDLQILMNRTEDPHVFSSYLNYSKKFGGESARYVLPLMSGVTPEQAMTALANPDAFSPEAISKMGAGGAPGSVKSKFDAYMATPGGAMTGNAADLSTAFHTLGKSLSETHQMLNQVTAQFGDAASHKGFLGVLSMMADVLTRPEMANIEGLFFGSKAIGARTPEDAAKWLAGGAVLGLGAMLRGKKGKGRQ